MIAKLGVESLLHKSGSGHVAIVACTSGLGECDKSLGIGDANLREDTVIGSPILTVDLEHFKKQLRGGTVA